jgi:hypothetical protein
MAMRRHALEYVMTRHADAQFVENVWFEKKRLLLEMDRADKDVLPPLQIA